MLSGRMAMGGTPCPWRCPLLERSRELGGAAESLGEAGPSWGPASPASAVTPGPPSPRTSPQHFPASVRRDDNLEQVAELLVQETLNLPAGSPRGGRWIR